MTTAVVAAPALAGAAENDWSPADGPLMTRWADEVRPDNVLPEYPRPHMVRDDWVNLNGLWGYAITETTEGADAPEEWDGEILVPFCVESALSGVMKRVSPEQTLWYRRTLQVEGEPGNDRVLLHFGAVDWHARVHVNGTLVGEHKGGYDPFTFDVTDALEQGENELIVEVTDPTDTAHQPHGKQFVEPRGIWYTPVTGIWQTVWMETVPAVHVAGLRVTPNVDEGQVEIEVEGLEEADDVEVRATVTGHGLEQQETADKGELTVKVPDAKLWSPDSPNLYDLKVELLRNGEVIDEVDSYFAMRKIEVKADDRGHNRLFLNDEPLFHFGMLDQGWWPDGLYTAPTDEALKYDLEMTKKWGFNTSRKHVKVEPARWYYHCDQMGILVWQDMPSVRNPSPNWVRDVNVKGPEAEFAPEAAEQFERELSEMVNDFYHFPSIVMWVPFNERWGQHDTAGAVELIRNLDPTRVINSASGGNFLQVGDVLDVHSYPNPSFPGLDEEQAVVCGEFGGLGLPVKDHVWQEQQNWGYRNYDSKEALTEAYLEKIDMLRPLIAQGLAAAIYTQTTDVEIEVNGLMTYDRAVIKIDPEVATKAASALYGPALTLAVVLPTAEQQPAEWSYTTSQPADNWASPDFDDSDWQRGTSGFGTPETPGATVNTRWDSDDIWIRRTFDLKGPIEDVRLRLHHDDDAQVYLNGVLAAEEARFTTTYQIVRINDKAKAALREGENVIAIHCRQNRRGQYIDAGLVRVTDGESDDQ